jgi:hypothetical protein
MEHYIVADQGGYLFFTENAARRTEKHISGSAGSALRPVRANPPFDGV